MLECPSLVLLQPPQRGHLQIATEYGPWGQIRPLLFQDRRRQLQWMFLLSHPLITANRGHLVVNCIPQHPDDSGIDIISATKQQQVLLVLGWVRKIL